MEAKELDLLDMLASILSKWREMIIALLVGAVLMGGISYVKSYRATQTQQPSIETKLDETSVQKKLEQLEKSLDDKEQATVREVVENEKECKIRKTYFENSTYMQLDPLHVAQTELIYQVRMSDGNENEQLGAVYEALLNNIGLYDWIARQVGIDVGYVEELISVDRMSMLPSSDGRKQAVWGTDCLKVTILQADTETCQQLADAVKSYISEQQKKLNAELNAHTLILLSETSGMGMNKDVMADQIKYGNEITVLQSKISTAEADFTAEQRQYFELLTWEEKGQIEQQTQEEKKAESIALRPSISKKYMLLGAVLFVFVYVVILGMQYIFNTKLRVSDELQSIYQIPQIGLVVHEPGKRLFLDKWIDELQYYGKRKFTAEQSIELAFVAVKIAVVKNGLSNICFIGNNLSAGADKVCEKLKAALEKEQIEVTVLDNVLYNAEAMEKMSVMQGAVLVEKAQSTLYNEITGELELLERQGITVLGGIIVE